MFLLLCLSFSAFVFFCVLVFVKVTLISSEFVVVSNHNSYNQYSPITKQEFLIKFSGIAHTEIDLKLVDWPSLDSPGFNFMMRIKIEGS